MQDDDEDDEDTEYFKLRKVVVEGFSKRKAFRFHNTDDVQTGQGPRASSA